MVKAFHNGNKMDNYKSELEVDEEAKVPRPEVDSAISNILSKKEIRYFLVTGERGTGKSTAIRKAIKAKDKNAGEKADEKTGVVYFMAANKDNAKQLGDAIGMKLTNPVLNLLLQAVEKEQTDKAYLTKLFFYLKLSSEKYKQTYQKPATLIIDACDLIAKNDKELLNDLQSHAKKYVDSKSLVIIFVSSEGLVLPLLEKSSDWSRAGRVCYIGDIPDEEAKKYLTDKKISSDTALYAVENVSGGRFEVLNKIANEMEGITDEDCGSKNNHLAIVKKMEIEFHAETNTDLKKIGVPKTNLLFKHLIKSGFVAKDKALDWVDEDKISSLLKANIISAHPDKTYAINVRHVKTYLEKEIKMIEEKEKREKEEKEKNGWFWWLFNKKK